VYIRIWKRLIAGAGCSIPWELRIGFWFCPVRLSVCMRSNIPNKSKEYLSLRDEKPAVP